MMRMLAAGAGLVGLLALGACSDAGGGARWAGTVTDSAGIQIVRNPETGTWRPEDRWTMTEALRIGAAEGDPNYQFGTVAGMAVASDGRIVVFDAQARHLKVFGADGAFERIIGRPGGGPGEVGTQGAQLVLAPGDTVVLSDIGNQRVSLFLLDGTFVRDFPQLFADGIPFRWETASDGRLVAQIRRLNLTGAAGGGDTMDLIVVRRLDGTMGDTLLRVPSGKTIAFSGGMPEWNLFVPEPLWALWGDRVLSAVNDVYRITVHRPGGAPERIVEKPFTLSPVTEVDQRVILSGFEKIFQQQGLPPEIAAQLLTRVHFAPNYPAFGQGGMVAGPDGTILVQLVRPISAMTPEEQESLDLQSGGGGSPDWDVFDRDGRYLGLVSFPPRFQPMRFLGDRVYGIQRDELDVPYVVVLELARGGGTAG